MWDLLSSLQLSQHSSPFPIYSAKSAGQCKITVGIFHQNDIELTGQPGENELSDRRGVCSFPGPCMWSKTESDQNLRALLSCSSHVQLCDSSGCTLPGSSVSVILQVRTLEWVAIFPSRGSSPPRNRTLILCTSCTGRQILYH